MGIRNPMLHAPPVVRVGSAQPRVGGGTSTMEWV